LESYKIIGINKDDETGFFIKEDIDWQILVFQIIKWKETQ
jgi:hypothetical protein